MQSRQFGLAEEMNAAALGFYEQSRNELRIVSHGGGTQSFDSNLHLAAEVGLGFFTSYNSHGTGAMFAPDAPWHAFLEA
jgi:hypothetical protein